MRWYMDFKQKQHITLLFPDVFDPELPLLLLPFSTSHILVLNGGLPRAARAPCSNKRLNEKSGKLNVLRLERRIIV